MEWSSNLSRELHHLEKLRAEEFRQFRKGEDDLLQASVVLF
jgi:hypothetical protein